MLVLKYSRSGHMFRSNFISNSTDQRHLGSLYFASVASCCIVITISVVCVARMICVVGLTAQSAVSLSVDREDNTFDTCTRMSDTFMPLSK